MAISKQEFEDFVNKYKAQFVGRHWQEPGIAFVCNVRLSVEIGQNGEYIVLCSPDEVLDKTRFRDGLVFKNKRTLEFAFDRLGTLPFNRATLLDRLARFVLPDLRSLKKQLEEAEWEVVRLRQEITTVEHCIGGVWFVNGKGVLSNGEQEMDLEEFLETQG